MSSILFSIANSTKILLILVCLPFIIFGIWFIWGEITWRPMTYADAKKAAPLNVQDFCKQRKISPCDFRLIKEEDSGGVWDFYYRSKNHHMSLRVEIYSDGEINVDTPVPKEIDKLLDSR